MLEGRRWAEKLTYCTRKKQRKGDLSYKYTCDAQSCVLEGVFWWKLAKKRSSFCGWVLYRLTKRWNLGQPKGWKPLYHPTRTGKAFWDTSGKLHEAQLFLSVSTPSLRSMCKSNVYCCFFKRQQNEHPILIPQARQRWEQGAGMSSSDSQWHQEFSGIRWGVQVITCMARVTRRA